MQIHNKDKILDFDLRLAKECADSFSLASGLGVTISDVNGNVLHDTGSGYSCCKLCSVSCKNFSCTASHIYGMDEAERFGGRYIYFCPAGLSFFVSPILNQLGSIAKLTAGPFLMVEPEDFMFLELQTYMGLSGNIFNRASEVVKSFPYVLPNKVTALSSMLYFSVSYISNVWKSEQLREQQNADAIQSSINDYIAEIKTNTSSTEYPYETERQLLHSIVSNDRETAAEALNNLLGYIFFAFGGDFDRIKTSIYELLILMSRSAIEGGAPADSTFRQNFSYLKQIQMFTDIDSLCLWITQTMNAFMDQTFGLSDVKHVNIIHKTLAYIHDHLDERITVDQAAANVYLSTSYFSKVFKKETGSAFNVYLNQIRIEKSKELLRNPKYRIVDVAIALGYDDQSYFTKVFKRFTGISPNHYREAFGR